MDAFMEMSNSKIKEVMERAKVEKWDVTYSRLVYDWAGHLARYTAVCPERWSLKALLHNNWQYLQKMKSLYGSQLHYKHFHAWRWEQMLYKFPWGKDYGDDWMQAAMDKTTWAAKRDCWTNWRCGY